MQVDWLLNLCEQSINKIQEEVLQATKVQQLGKIAHKTGWDILLIHQLLVLLCERKLHHGLCFAHAYIRR